MPDGAARCEECRETDHAKQEYLHTKGLKKGLKLGKVLIFYNQCQLLEHLQNHDILNIEMTDIMLLPLPKNIQTEEYPQLEIVCKALMEHMFIKRVHIMDWLRNKKIDSNSKWWTTGLNNDNPVADLLKTYDPDGINIADSIPNISTIITGEPRPKKKKKTGYILPTTDNNLASELNSAVNDFCERTSESSEDDDNPCDDTDINETNIIDVPIELPTRTYPSKKLISPMPVVATLQKPPVTSTSATTINNSLLIPTNSPQIVSSNLTNLNISTNPGRLTFEAIKNKKYIIISQTCDKTTGATIMINDPKTPVAVGPQIGQGDNLKTPKVPIPKLTGIKKNPIIVTHKNSSFLRNDGQVILQPGSKVILRQLQKNLPSVIKIDAEKTAPLVSLPSSKINILSKPVKIKPRITENTEKKTEIPTAIVSPIPTEEIKHLVAVFKRTQIKALGCNTIPISDLNNSAFLKFWGDTEINKKTSNATYNVSKNRPPELLSLRFGDNRKLYVQKQTVGFKDLNTNSDKIKSHNKLDDVLVIAKYRKALLDDMELFGKTRAQPIIDDLKAVSVKYINSKGVDMSAILSDNLRSMKRLETFLNTEVARNDGLSNHHIQINEKFDNDLREWEKKYQESTAKGICRKCRLIVKPKYYIPGISKPAIKESDYCQCYNYICHKCKARQGNSRRYKAHLKFHAQDRPFQCPECYITPMTMSSLERHIWTKCFHIGTQHYFACKICDIKGFLTLEDITRHFVHIHAHSAVICNECDLLLCSYTDYKSHYLEDHKFAVPIPQPERLLICDAGHCLVRPENYRAHLQTHSEIDKISYFICPFCSFFIKDKIANHDAIHTHVFFSHTLRLREVMTRETLQYFTAKFNLSVPLTHRFVPIAPAADTSLPKIINTCSIAANVFERTLSHNKSIELTGKTADETTEDNQTQSSQQQLPKLPKIVNISSGIDQVNSEINEVTNEMVMPKIVSVTSIDKSAFKPNEKEKPKRIVMFSPQKTTNGDLTIQDADGKIRTFPSIVAMKINSKNDKNPLQLKKHELSDREISIVKVPVEKKQLNALDKHQETIDTITHEELIINSDTEPAVIDSEILIEPKIEELDDSPLILESTDIPLPEPLLLNSQLPLTLPETPVTEPIASNTKEKVTKELMENILQSLKKRKRKKLCRIALNGPNNSDTSINYKCHLCGELINTSWSVIKGHFDTKHSKDYEVSIITPKLERISSETMEMELKESAKKRKLDTSSPITKRRGRWGHRKYSDKPNSPSLGICVRQESLQDTEGNFKCKKCDQLFKDVNVLRGHVAMNHRIRGHFLICLECGENFVVAPSLQMHLKAFHGIMDPINYMAQNTAYAPDVMDELEAQEKITESNQCHVCMAVFLDKAAVDKHLRVHGMAFLNRKRIEARKALKSPEKLDQTDLSRTKNNQESKLKDPTNTDNETILEDTDTANVSILTRISRLLT